MYFISNLYFIFLVSCTYQESYSSLPQTNPKDITKLVKTLFDRNLSDKKVLHYLLSTKSLCDFVNPFLWRFKRNEKFHRLCREKLISHLNKFNPPKTLLKNIAGKKAYHTIYAIKRLMEDFCCITWRDYTYVEYRILDEIVCNLIICFITTKYECNIFQLNITDMDSEYTHYLLRIKNIILHYYNNITISFIYINHFKSLSTILYDESRILVAKYFNSVLKLSKTLQKKYEAEIMKI
ncbi:hypothetical protein SLOPH_1130 [Spraguea lophii 42_110]|uniref:Uncharacterized protein n=1 Tax=Spraguea lophii (strain 42_110) TaxID=1358809 RepID=S7W6R3_SPRLO|nr:hypothetical protein SLOPH_1130 [Spraguea lophii 42_110]